MYGEAEVRVGSYDFNLTFCCSVSMKDIKSFLPRVNCKISTSKLREYFQEVDTKKRNEITFDEFVTFYQKLMFDDNVSIVRNRLREKYSFSSA